MVRNWGFSRGPSGCLVPPRFREKNFPSFTYRRRGIREGKIFSRRLIQLGSDGKLIANRYVICLFTGYWQSFIPKILLCQNIFHCFGFQDPMKEFCATIQRQQILTDIRVGIQFCCIIQCSCQFLRGVTSRSRENVILYRWP